MSQISTRFSCQAAPNFLPCLFRQDKICTNTTISAHDSSPEITLVDQDFIWKMSYMGCLLQTDPDLLPEHP